MLYRYRSLFEMKIKAWGRPVIVCYGYNFKLLKVDAVTIITELCFVKWENIPQFSFHANHYLAIVDEHLLKVFIQPLTTGWSSAVKSKFNFNTTKTLRRVHFDKIFICHCLFVAWQLSRFRIFKIIKFFYLFPKYI